MEIIIGLLFLALLFSSVCFVYVVYLLRRTQEHLRSMMKICDDAVESIRAGKG